MLSIVLATYNEENFISRCLSAIQDIADEIIVVDGQSTDGTVAVAQKFNAKVIVTTNKPMFHINKQMAIDVAKGDWILQLDADEVVDERLKSEIKSLTSAKNVDYNAYSIPRKNYFLGRFLTKGGQYPDRKIRLFKSGKAYLPQKSVHEDMIVTGKIGQLSGHILHYNAPTFSRYLANFNRYTSLTAQDFSHQRLRINIKSFITYTIFKPISTFFSIFLRHKGFIDGFRGFIFALFSGLHFTVAFFKYWELKHK